MRGLIMPVELHVPVHDRGQMPAVGRLLIECGKVGPHTTTGDFSILRTLAWEAPYRLTDRPRFVLGPSTIRIQVFKICMAERRTRRGVSQIAMCIGNLSLQTCTYDRHPHTCGDNAFSQGLSCIHHELRTHC
ncbi:hypothetical protein D9M71_397180 [compost metagenome]